MVQNNQQLRRMNIPKMSAGDDPVRYAETLRKLVQDEFNRLSTDFYQFRQQTLQAAVIPLKPVSQIATTADQYGVSVTWENPQQDTITPTHVRIRIAEVMDEFAEYTYPINSWEFNGLLPGTDYTVEIELIARYEDTISYVSATRNCPSLPVQRIARSAVVPRSFTTAAGVGPPEQGTGNTTTFPFPDTDTPGPVGGTDCWWEYIFQMFDEAGTGGTWEDTIYTGEIDGDIDLIDFDQTQLDCTVVHRLNYREVCNGVPGTWIEGSPFIPACDWADDCGGVSANQSFGSVPFTSADLFGLPVACVRDGEFLTIEDSISEIQLTTIPDGYDTIYREDDWTLVGRSASALQQPLLVGVLPTIGTLNGQDSFSTMFEWKAPASAGSGTFIVLFMGTKFRVSVNQVPGGFTFSMIAAFDGGGMMVLTSTSIIPVDTWTWVGTRVDASLSGLHSIWIDGVKEAETVNSIELDLNGITEDLGLFTLDGMEIRNVYGWNRALDDDEFTINIQIPGVAGYICGGVISITEQTAVDRFAFPTDVRSATTSMAAGEYNSAPVWNDGVAGYLMGARNASGGLAGYNDIIRKLIFPAETWSVLVATMAQRKHNAAGMSNSGVAGYTMGGANGAGFANTTIKLAFPAETTSSLAATLVNPTEVITGMSDKSVAGYASGGQIAGNILQTNVNKLSFTAETRSVLGTGLSSAREGSASFSDEGVAGYVAGGSAFTTVDKFAFPGDTRSTLGTGLSAATNRSAGFADDSTAGYAQHGGSSSSTVVDKFAYPTDTRTTLGTGISPGRGFATGLQNGGA